MEKIYYDGFTNNFKTNEPVFKEVELATKVDLESIPKIEMSVYGQVAIDFYILEGQSWAKIRNTMKIPIKEGMKTYTEVYKYLEEKLLKKRK